MSDANFTPTLGEYKTLQPFRYWCQKVLPLVYDDSLSYYELLCKVIDYLNKTMEDVETLHKDVSNLHIAYTRLQEFVNNYFKNLDVQQEINKKLDDMVKDGTLSELLNAIIGNDYVNVKLYGCIGDGVTDDTNSIIRAINYCVDNNKILYFPLGDYLITSNLPDLPKDFCCVGVPVGNKINGYGSRIIDKRTTSTPLFNLINGENNGGYFRDMIFDDPEHQIGKTCIYRTSGGWTFLIHDCSFFSYDTALYLEGDDGRIENCQFALCGSNKKNILSPKYCIEINQSNEKRFTGCHFEHIRFMVHIKGSSYFNTFENCKFEQGTPNSDINSSKGVIEIESTQYNYTNSFINCAFHCIDLEYYVDKGIINSYEDAPYMINQYNDTLLQISSCAFTCGPGSGSTIYKQFSQGRFVKSQNAQIDNCSFIKPSYLAYCMEFKNALLNNNIFTIDFSGEYSLTGGNTLINRTFYPYNYYMVANTFIKNMNSPTRVVVLDNNGSDYLSNIDGCIKTNYYYSSPYMCFEIHPRVSPFNGIWDVKIEDPLQGYNIGTFTFAVESNKITIVNTANFIRSATSYNITICVKDKIIYVFIPGSNANSRGVTFSGNLPCNIYFNNNIKNIIEAPDSISTVWS